jgi:hypothetical protein
MGTVMAVFDDTNVQYTDTSTTDLGLDTNDIDFSVTNSGSVISLNAIVTAYTWDVKTGVRII